MPDELNVSDGESGPMDSMPEPASSGGMKPIWGILIVILAAIIAVGAVGYWYLTTEPGSDTSGAIKFKKSEEATGGTEEMELVQTSSLRFDYAYPKGWHVYKNFGPESSEEGNIYNDRTYISRTPIFFYPSEVSPSDITLTDYEPNPNAPSGFKNLEQRINDTKESIGTIISEEKVKVNDIEATKIVGRYENQIMGPENYRVCHYFFSYHETQNNVDHVVVLSSSNITYYSDDDFEIIKSAMEKMFEQFNVGDTSTPASYEDMKR